MAGNMFRVCGNMEETIYNTAVMMSDTLVSFDNLDFYVVDVYSNKRAQLQAFEWKTKLFFEEIGFFFFFF